MRNKVLVVLGPTSSGKSDLAVEIARKFNGEVISADSRQVYKGMDIGTGKVTQKEMKGIKHHLLDVVSPKKVFTVSDFKRLAEEKIEEILGRGKLPILCGGTGFYIKTIVDGEVYPEVAPNEDLRKDLETKSAEELYKILYKLSRKRSLGIDKKNKRRLVRAIEIIRAGALPNIKKEKPKYDFLQIGILPDDDTLKDRINRRLLARIKRGMIAEARKLHTKGLSYKRMEVLGLEYRYMARFLKGEISKEEMIENLKNKIWQYAKRQKTWFKKDKRVLWVKDNKLNEDIIKTTIKFIS